MRYHEMHDAEIELAAYHTVQLLFLHVGVLITAIANLDCSVET